MTINTTQNKSQKTEEKKLPSVQLALNGKPIYLLNPVFNVKVVREEKDMSGQNSSTKKSDQGVKAKELSVSGVIPFREKTWLSALFKYAEAESGKGEQVKYRISNISAEACNMREGVFSGEVSANEQGQGWAVSFTLREVNSVAEKKAKRKKKPKAKVQKEKASVQGGASTTSTVTPPSGESTAKKPQQERTEWDKKIEDFERRMGI